VEQRAKEETIRFW